MKRWMQLAAQLYPASWRKRYAVELQALLDDAQLTGADFWDILRGALKMQMTAWTFGKLAAAGALAGLAIAGYIAMRSPSMYLSTAVLRMTPQASGANWMADMGGQLTQAEQRVLSRQSLQPLITANNLYPEERRQQPIEDIVQDMRNRYITIRMLDGAKGPAFSISFQYRDPAKAQFVTRQLIEQLSAAMPSNGPANLEVLDPASLPGDSFAPNRPVMMAVGLALGLLFGSMMFGVGRWPKVAATGFATAIVVLIGSLFVPDHYLSTAVVRSNNVEKLQETLMKTAGDTAFLQSVIEKLDLYPKERRTKPIATVIAQMRDRYLRVQMLKIPGRPPATAAAAAISFIYPDQSRILYTVYGPGRYKAQAVVRELVAHCMELSVADPSGGKLEVLDPASLPEQPFEPNRQKWVVLGLFGGLLAGIAWRIGGKFRRPVLNHA